MEKCSNLSATIGGYDLKNLVYNLDRTVLVGSVEDRNNMGDGLAIKSEYILTKWDIDRKNKVCKCQLGDVWYDISLEGKFILSLLEDEVPVKNFYTFNTDAWHCRLYKWVFGKEAHKVHPTMCPYFWIMVLVLCTFPIVFSIRLTGKAGMGFMEACKTYNSRRKDRIADNYTTSISNRINTMTDAEAYAIQKTDKYKKYKWHLSWDIRDRLDIKYGKHSTFLSDQRYEKKIALEAYKQSQIKVVPNNTIIKKKQIRQAQISDLRESKTAKIIGILLVSIVGLAIGYLFITTLITLFEWINWKWVGYGIVIIAVLAGSFTLIYITARYVFSPILVYLYDQIVSLVRKIKKVSIIGSQKIRSKMPKVNMPKINMPFYQMKIKFLVAFKFMFGWIGQLLIILLKGFIYMIDFFKMAIDLISSMYHKNCPRITWENNNKQ